MIHIKGGENKLVFSKPLEEFMDISKHRYPLPGERSRMEKLKHLKKIHDAEVTEPTQVHVEIRSTNINRTLLRKPISPTFVCLLYYMRLPHIGMLHAYISSLGPASGEWGMGLKILVF